MYCINREGEVISKTKNTVQQKVENTVNENTAIKQIGIFSKYVVEKMLKENIPATPENYAIYFEKLLEEKPLPQRQNIQKILEAETIEKHNYAAHIENNIKDSFKQIKIILENVSNMYTKINKLRILTKNKIQEISSGSSQIALVAYEEQLDDIVQALEKQQKSIKERYSDIAEKIKAFHANTVFDPKYDVYNKNFLLKTIESEKKNVFSFKYESSLIAFKIQESSLLPLTSQKDKEMVTKNIATMILKRSRRSDIVAHFGNDIFVIVLKHTTITQAERVIESIDTLIGNTNYIVDSQQIDVALEYGLGKITHNQTKDQILSTLITQLS